MLNLSEDLSKGKFISLLAPVRDRGKESETGDRQMSKKSEGKAYNLFIL